MLRLASLFLFLICVTSANAGDWPQWLGPDRDGTSPESINPWKGPPKVVWRQPVGQGHSSAIAAGVRIFLHAGIKDKDEEEVIAFDATDGTRLWQTSYVRGKFDSPFGNGPRATPAVDGDRIYTFGVTGVLTCLRTDSGKIVWQVDTLKDFQAPNLTFGVSCSPLIHGNLVLVNAGGKGASVVAFDKENGKVVWHVLDDAASYASPIIFGKDKEQQVIFLTQQGLVSLDPTAGTVFWKFSMVDALSESSTTPVHLGDLLLASSVTYGSVGLQVGVSEKKPTETQLWKNAALTCYFSTPVPVGTDNIYMVTGNILPPQATLHCIEAKTGKDLWHKPKVGKYHASLLRTGNGKLLLLEDAGNLVLLDPDPKEYRELARAKVAGETWAHPALANGRLYIRDDKELICLKMEE